ncbi:MAG: gamma-glutamyltransferase [Bacteroidota bacterium]
MRYVRLLLVVWMGWMMPLPAHSQAPETADRGDRPAGATWATRSPVLAQNGIAATSHPLASQVAIDVLKRGGSAVDAAIAANAALGLMEPTGCGIGGDLYAIVWDPVSQRLHGLNASGRSPRGLRYDDMMAAIGEAGAVPEWGPLSVSVPGAVDGWFELHERYGTLSMTEVLQPAIDYARDGFPLSQMIADGWAMNMRRFAANQNQIPELANAESTYLVDGEVPTHGSVFRNPDLARTYATLARDGRDAFYEGALADVMDAYMQRIGGPMRKADFEAHTSTWVTPVSVNYRGHDVYELPPNGQGIAALQQLNMLEGFDLASMGWGSADYLHVHTETKKLAFEDRARFYADMDFFDVPLDGLLDKDYATQRRLLIERSEVLQDVRHGDPRLQDGDTIYLTVADRNGMMVSLIQSNYMGMGSGLVPDGLGFMFQNRGALFALDQDHPNVYAPGKRPFHTIIPAFVMKDGAPFMSFGLMGGDMQPQGHAQIITNIVDFGMNVQEAGDAARYRHNGSSSPMGDLMTDGGVLQVESGFDPAVLDDLRKRGHTVEVVNNGSYGGYQAIIWDAVNKVYWGGTEMRKDGIVIGY